MEEAGGLTRGGSKKCATMENTSANAAKGEARYSQRANKKKVDYSEEQEPEADRWIYCDGCETDVVDWCRSCGRLARLRDSRVAPAQGGAAAGGLRAQLTAPRCVELRPSQLHGVGAFARAPLPRGVCMGPYEGRRLAAGAHAPGGCAWRLRDGTLVDGADAARANWMRYVNCAPKAPMQNLVAYQYRADIYYRTVQPIAAGEELLVYYGDEYARLIGIDVENYFEGGQGQGQGQGGTGAPQVSGGDVMVVGAEETPVGPGGGLEEAAPEADGKDAGRCHVCSHCGIGLIDVGFKKRHEEKCLLRRRKENLPVVSEVFECKHCRGSFVDKERRDKHENKTCQKRSKYGKANVEDVVFKCDFCEYTTTRKNDLKRHNLVHNKENARWYSCGNCAYKTLKRGNLISHQMIHDNEFSFVCPLCKKYFRRKVELDQHLVRNHYSDAPEKVSELVSYKIYQCDICNNFRTVMKSNFKRHLEIVHLKGSGLQAHSCTQCTYSTFRKGDLKVHMRIHSGQMPFLCRSCSKSFNEKRQLDGHILNNHAHDTVLLESITSKVHRCPHCPFKTVYATHLKQHQRNARHNLNK